ncbi:hypothetical protein [Streptomyces pseudogriseolus]|uniref:hypothetical protein n=1 Tax=Streptomyces pseudogriseolus TaxID=36817 RepID=UPI00347D4517|nr:hypothetical protein [Streptomyces pseudogriseolus]
MSTPGGRTPCSHPTRHHRVSAPRLTRSTQRAGRLLCWSLTAGMTTAATDILLTPQADWWQALWPAPWYLTPLAALTWAALRAHEKAEQHPPDDDTLPDQWDQAA